MTHNEQDLRVTILNTLLTTPHRDLASIYPVHQAMIAQDPLFYVHLAAWYAAEGEVRDHKEMFVVNLALSDFQDADGVRHRDVGLALLRELPPYQVGRVLDFVKGRVVRRKVKYDDKEEVVIEKRGLFRNVPRSLKTEITRYLREREANPERFDGAALHARKTLKRLYASLHIQPAARAQAILFEDNPPQDSRLYALKIIGQAQTPAEQARAIVENAIPYRVAATIIKQMTPTVLVALVNSMSPQEVINNVNSLKRHGAFENEDVKALIEDKLAQAKSDTRVSAYKAKVAAQAVGAGSDVAEKLEAVTEAQVKAVGAIKRPTALLIDKSGSMNVAIEVGKQLGAMVSAICEADLFAYAFDTVAYPIQPHSTALADWEKALKGIQAGGATSCGVALDQMRKQNQRVEQIVMITDEQENRAPLFENAYREYAEALNIRPDVVFVKVGGANDMLARVCARLGIAPTAFTFRGDYYALPNVIPMLTRPSTADLVMEILAYPLPKRQ